MRRVWLATWLALAVSTAARADTVAVQTGAAPEKEKAPATVARDETPKFTYGGSADFYWLTNFNDPFNDTAALRAFDLKDDVHLGLIDIWGQYARDPYGFRIDLDWGSTASLVNAFEPTRTSFWKHVQQLYVSANLNKSGTDYVEFGKWVTNAGAEVIEPKDNWLHSRGLLFTWAIPFYHLGARFYHYTSDTDYVAAAINRGWNAVSSPGHGPGWMLMGNKVVNDRLTLTGSYHGGDEILGTSKGYRSLFDVVATYKAGPKTTYLVNVDYAVQGSVNWYGISAMGKYDLDPKSYLAARFEWLADPDGGLFGADSDAYSITLGYARTLHKFLQARVEYRHDFASGISPFASDRAGAFKDDQGSFVISTILSY